MFTADGIREIAQERPFKPFRITMSSGHSQDVTHPELLWVGHREIRVSIALPDDPIFYVRIVRLAIGHITEIRDLPAGSAAPSAEGNGNGAG